MNITMRELKDIRTQKAKGLRHLVGGWSPPFQASTAGWEASAANPRNVKLIQSTEELEYPIHYPIFARPCPLTPRHGFVESRTVNNVEELRQVWAETVKEDPQGELLLMDRETGAISAVATNAGVSFGHGHDGVTGDGATKHIPFLVPAETWNFNTVSWTESSCRELGITDAAYVELVEGNDHFKLHSKTMVAVQIRNGPAQSGDVDFVPKGFTVKHVLRHYDRITHRPMDLLKWERTLKNAVRDNGGKPDGLVFYLQNGSLSSHYAVHAVQLDIPVVTSFQPTVGQTIAPTGLASSKPKLRARDYRKIARYIRKFNNPEKFQFANNFRNGQYSLFTALASVHASAAWGRDDHLLALRAFGVVVLTRYLLAITAGEDRHYSTAGPGNHNGRKPKGRLETVVGPLYWEGAATDRNTVIEAFLRVPFERTIGLQAAIAEDFLTKGWNGNYGGRRWGRVSRANLRILRYLDRFLAKPNAKNWLAVTLVMNRAVNMVHNGQRKLLTKIIGEGMLNRISENPTFGFLNPVTGHLILGDDYFFSPNLENDYGTKEQASQNEGRDFPILNDDLERAFARLLEDQSDSEYTVSRPRPRYQARRGN